jgi:hypothetical protein
MGRRRRAQAGARVTDKLLEIKPIYTVAELSVALRMTRQGTLKMLRREGVPTVPRVPTARVKVRVFYNSLHFAMPDLFDSIARAQSDRRGGRGRGRLW